MLKSENTTEPLSNKKHYEKRVDAKGRESEPVCIEDEIPFEIPESWEWSRLQTVLSLNSGLGYKKTDLDAKSSRMKRVLRGGNISANDELLLQDSDVFIADQFVEDELQLYPGQIITPAVTSLENVGKAALIRQRLQDTVCGGFVFYLTPFLDDFDFSDYVYHYLISPNHKKYCRKSVKKSGQAFYNLLKASLNQALIPIPPANEQTRILQQCNKVNPFISKYAALETAREQLDTELPNQLRKSILQMAIQGKLVPQEPNDEPASVLLERIREQRWQLIAEGKSKAPKGGESVIFRGSDGGYYEKRGDAEPNPIEVPYDIPDSWEWARMSSLIELLSGTDLNANQYNDLHEGIPYLTGASNFDFGKLIENRWTSTPTRISKQGELLFTCKGTIGEMAINQFKEAHIARQIMAIIPYDLSLLDYLQLFLSAMVEEIKTQAKGVIPGIERNTLLDAFVPLPPEYEQTRILERCGVLQRLCS